MEKIGNKTRDINFFSQKNAAMFCVHNKFARDYAKYLENCPEVECFEAGVPLERDRYQNIDTLGIRKAYFEIDWASDFYVRFFDGRSAIRELLTVEKLRKLAEVEKLEFSRRYWMARGVSDWRVVVVNIEAQSPEQDQKNEEDAL